MNNLIFFNNTRTSWRLSTVGLRRRRQLNGVDHVLVFVIHVNIRIKSFSYLLTLVLLLSIG